MPKLVNLDRNVSINFSFTDEPREIMKEITQQGAVGSIGLISLRSLIAGNVAEVSGYLIIEDDAADTVNSSGETADKAAIDKEALEKVVSDKAAVEEKAKDTAVEEKAVMEKVIEATTEPELTQAAPEEKLPELSAEERKSAANAAIKKTFGVNVDNSEGNFTPAQKATESKRPRRDMVALLAKAKAGKNAGLIAAVEAAGYTVVNVENSERWFGVTSNEFELVRQSPRFDISVLKNGSFSVSLYINDLATGIKAKVGSEVTVENAVGEVVKLMAGDIFKDSLATYKASIPATEAKA